MPHESWHTEDFPEFRERRPWVMQEMIEAEPGLAEPVLTDPAASVLGELVRSAADAGAPVAVVGCGTSEHGAMAVAEQITEALGGRAVAHSRQAFEAMLDPWAGGVCVGVSHEGGTAATVAAMESAHAAGATIGLITAAGSSAGAKAADHALVTPVRDRSWCHTVGYVSPILGGAAVAAAAAGATVGAAAAARALSVAPDVHDRIREVAASLSGVARYLTVGSGADRIAARELALKIEEGVRVPATARDLETILHGHWVAPADDRPAAGGRARRARLPDPPRRGRDRRPDGRHRHRRHRGNDLAGRRAGRSHHRPGTLRIAAGDRVAPRIGAGPSAADARTASPGRREPRPHPPRGGAVP
jgi:glutamine---fructose-6-phosphate transaminase (isomerizing)